MMYIVDVDHVIYTTENYPVTGGKHVETCLQIHRC